MMDHLRRVVWWPLIVPQLDAVAFLATTRAGVKPLPHSLRIKPVGRILGEFFGEDKPDEPALVGLRCEQ